MKNLFLLILLNVMTAVATAVSLPTQVLAQHTTHFSQRHGLTQISGEFVRMIDDDEFILNTANGQIVVEADSRRLRAINLTPGERIIVNGRYDDDEFDGYVLIRENGESFVIRD